MKTLLSLFDYSGQWSDPFAANGWNVIQWDIKLSEFMDINLITDAEVALELFEDVNGIIAGAPCTDFAVSGAWKWAEKDADGRTAASIELVRQVQRLANLFTPTDEEYSDVWFWAVENPVGRIGQLCGLEDPYWFQPWEFAGNVAMSEADTRKLMVIGETPLEQINRQDAMLVMQSNRYTKKTGLWGDFNRELKKHPLAPIRCCSQGSPLQKLGGKSDRTKEIRSLTPVGFAQAFYEANHQYRWTPQRHELFHQPA